jgi:hypothetical protein
MARPSRAERRRQNSRTGGTPTAPAVVPAAQGISADVSSDQSAAVAPQAAPQPSRLIRSTRRMAANTSARVYDQAAEYAVISHDLRRIAMWGSILIVAMLVLNFANIF